MRKLIISAITTAALFALAGGSAANMLMHEAASVASMPNPLSVHTGHDGHPHRPGHAPLFG
jgi:hypothetical protein